MKGRAAYLAELEEKAKARPPRTGRRTGPRTGANAKYRGTAKKVWLFLATHPGWTRQEIAEALGLPQRPITNAISHLRKHKKLDQVTIGPGSHGWKIPDRLISSGASLSEVTRLQLAVLAEIQERTPTEILRDLVQMEMNRLTK